MSDRQLDAFVPWALQSADVLELAACEAAQSGDAARAVGLAWSADLHRVQGALWSELVVTQQLSRREFFHILQDLVASPDDAPALSESAQDALDRSRMTLLAGLGEIIPDGVALAHVPELASLPAPDADAWDRLRLSLLSGMRPDDLVETRRRQSADLMLRALRAQQSGDDAEAIRLAYDSDMASLEAYLVESATAVGDAPLVTVAARWALVAHRMSGLPALPWEFLGAVRAVRMVLAEALGDSDGARMLAGLQSFSA